MILLISMCQFKAKHIPDAFKLVPDFFWKLRHRKIRKKHEALKNLKLLPKMPLGSLSINSSSFAAICGIIADHAFVCTAWLYAISGDVQNKTISRDICWTNLGRLCEYHPHSKLSSIQFKVILSLGFRVWGLGFRVYFGSHTRNVAPAPPISFDTLYHR